MDSPPEVENVQAKHSGFFETLKTLFCQPFIYFVFVSTFVILYKFYYKYKTHCSKVAPLKKLPKLRKDMTAVELRQYDGTQEGGRVLMAVNGWIFDVTRGNRFYGPGGPYAVFGGRDATRGLATFSVTAPEKDYDDLSDLNSMEMESVREWEEQFRENYDLVGRLLRPGEEPRNYSDEEPEEADTSALPNDDKKTN
ncbi:membrane-associated progesterone receptor component 2-like [Bombyx mandarina]|nr:progesterone receptor membrane component 2 isoform X1 [Bombyx mori]XP_028028475.1 membrane-associated progesterone receptor component 2-like [Bombyx mandarina]